MHGDVGQSRAPDFVILGAPKSGSTWLTGALRRHPGIFIPTKAVAFFEDAHYRENRFVEDVSQLFAQAPEEALLGIRRSTYLNLAEGPARIARHLPQARLIAILRQPVDRAISQLFHQLREGQISACDPDRLIARYLRGEFETSHLQAKILESGRYAEALSRYHEYFPPQQLLVLTDIEVRRDAMAAYSRVCRFLDLPAGRKPAGLALRRNYGIYAPFLVRLANRLNRVRYENDVTSGEVRDRPGAVPWLAGQGVLALQRGAYLASLLGLRQKPRVSAATRAALMAYYREDINRLEQMLNIDLSPWKRQWT